MNCRVYIMRFQHLSDGAVIASTSVKALDTNGAIFTGPVDIYVKLSVTVGDQPRE